ncbi:MULTISPECIES: zf-HC2 domain-containing protein [unclassified Nostoc]|uniref:anti-sigma factor family protein n=1 Tax=unclassified Nostoc TaxID=2593658 RepID=UPI0025AA6B11|nr:MULTISPECIES: zf-HC2 domain-containing protein [unclassified Nostoc]MDM9584578.1 zf-HC2 domain-containing protein [Nostoc sp. GT001]MDZ7945206.1 zf-HC2 domain-containing protein [Nostoc sp. EfeVER01]MDZ7993209.1 zf-HC2 domain-containing protein [Nostoc sp. EspVER01]
MTTDSQFYDRSPLQLPQDLSDGMAKHTNESTGLMDMVKRDRFELLSAYLDGEVTATERRQVEEWLANDASVQCLYARLLKLRQGLRTLPVPAAQQSPEETVQQVLSRLRRRSRLNWMVGSAAVAACAIGAISGLVGGGSMVQQLAQRPQRVPIQTSSASIVPPSPLMVGLNNPVIEIPKAAVASPENSIYQVQPQGHDPKQDIN